MKALSTILIILLGIAPQLKAQKVSNFYLYEGNSIVELSINGKKAWGLIDPGVAQTIFNTQDADFYEFDLYPAASQNYKVQYQEQLRDYNRVVTDLSLSGEPLFGLKMACDISDVIAKIKNDTGKRISVIIGSNMMKHHGFILDLGNQTIEVPALLAVIEKKQADSLSLR